MKINLEIFDSIIGYEGSAAVEKWTEMSTAEIAEEAAAQAEYVYHQPISNIAAQRIANAVIKYRDAENANDRYHVRAELDDE